jgi:hypothetical protein
MQRTLFALCGVAYVGAYCVNSGLASIAAHCIYGRLNFLAQEMRGRRDAAVEFQAALRERSRLAANLHDTVLQTMTGIAYQIEACEAESIPADRAPCQSSRNSTSHGAARTGGFTQFRLGASKALPMKEHNVHSKLFAAWLGK